MNDMMAFLYIASLFAIGGAAFSLMWKNFQVKEVFTLGQQV